MRFDVIIIGAGAAGLMCALTAGQRGRSVLLLDHARKLAEKIRISGGGRCNFTNLNADPDNYLSENPHFCRSALARYAPQDFIALLQKHRIAYSEKTLGQLFCDDGSEAIIAMLREECEAAGVQRLMGCEIGEIKRTLYSAEVGGGKQPRLYLSTSLGDFDAASLVVATGGLSIPKTGATPFGYQIAQQFGIPVTKLKAGLVPLSFAPDDWQPYVGLTGISLSAIVSTGDRPFRENLLITHRGLSGPAILQASSYWQPGATLHINLLPDYDLATLLAEHRNGKKLLSNFLAQWLPKNFAEVWCENNKSFENKPLNQYSDKQLKLVTSAIHDWQVTPSGTLGYAKAEVTCGGVDTRALSSKTMECQQVPGLYFVGEVMDVTGQLGGYNFQWAWASGHAAGEAV